MFPVWPWHAERQPEAGRNNVSWLIKLWVFLHYTLILVPNQGNTHQTQNIGTEGTQESNSRKNSGTASTHHAPPPPGPPPAALPLTIWPPPTPSPPTPSPPAPSPPAHKCTHEEETEDSHGRQKHRHVEQSTDSSGSNSNEQPQAKGKGKKGKAAAKPRKTSGKAKDVVAKGTRHSARTTGKSSKACEFGIPIISSVFNSLNHPSRITRLFAFL